MRIVYISQYKETSRDPDWKPFYCVSFLSTELTQTDKLQNQFIYVLHVMVCMLYVHCPATTGT